MGVKTEGSFKKGHKAIGGFETRFKKGHTPWHKGKNIKTPWMFNNKNPNYKNGKSYGYIRRRIETTRPKPEQCEVCDSKEKICLDYNHKTGIFRGWICHKCNVSLGMANDDINILKKLVKYLKKNN